MARLLILSAVIYLVTASFSVTWAQTEEKKESELQGVLKISEEFQIFPAGKFGNTIYRNNKRLVSKKDLILQDIVEAPEGNVYYGKDEAGQAVFEYIGNKQTKFIHLEGGFYQLISSQGINKIFRLAPNHKIQDLLPRYKTASGLVFNQVDKAAFSHIAKGEEIETDEGKLLYQYTFKIHIAKINTAKIIHLPEAINDFDPRLKLKWLDNDTLQYTLSSGETVSMKIR